VPDEVLAELEHQGNGAASRQEAETTGPRP
jgi:hypothetical protein